MPRARPLNPDLRTPARTAEVSPWVIAILLGFVLRLVIAYVSIGTNDTRSFLAFAGHIKAAGLMGAYQQNPQFNHPPLSGLGARGLLWVTEQAHGAMTGDPEQDLSGHVMLFTFLLKLPCIAADAGVCLLLYRIWAARAGDGPRMAAAYALALGPILVGSYHGNTDNVYAALALLAAWLLSGTRPRPLLAGLALAAAANVKLIPLLLAPVLLLACRRPREMALFVAGLAVGAVPYLPVVWADLFVAERSTFFRNVVSYTPEPDAWGLAIPLTVGRPHPPQPGRDDLLLFLKANGRYLILLLIAAWAVAWRVRGRRHDVLTAAAATFAVFLVFAPGFGVQYMVAVAPLLFAAAPRWLSTAYGLASGLCCGAAYLIFLKSDGIPFYSEFVGYLPLPAVAFGAVAWGLLGAFLVIAARAELKRGGVAE